MSKRLLLLTPLLAALLVAGYVWMGSKPKAVGMGRHVQKGETSMAPDPATNSPAPPKTDAEWQKVLTPEQYRVTRQKGTEAPFSGQYYKTDREGVYRCACCGAPLFSSETKFDAHCGWPSFWKAVEEGNIKSLEDHSHGMQRTEIQCRNCGAHLGHLFDDGPQPTGMRYCINSVSLKLDEKKPADQKR